MITFAFMIAAGLIEIGEIIGVDLQITTLLGWFVLASLIVNEARSICENFVEAGFQRAKNFEQRQLLPTNLLTREKRGRENENIPYCRTYGAGDPGAGCGYKANLTRELVNLIAPKLGKYATVDVYNRKPQRIL